MKTILPTNALQVIFIQPFVIVPHSPTSASGTACALHLPYLPIRWRYPKVRVDGCMLIARWAELWASCSGPNNAACVTPLLRTLTYTY